MDTQKFNQAKKDAVTSFVSLFSIFVFILITSPNSLPIGLILVLPILISVFSFNLSRFLLQLFTDFSGTRINIISKSIGVGLLLIFVLGSFKQLYLKDLVLLGLLISGIAFYLVKTRQGLQAD